MEAIWNANPNINLLYCFEDGNCFEKLNDAASYAKETGNTYTVKQRPTNEEEKAMKAEVTESNEAEVTESNEVETEETEIKNKPTKKSNK